LRLREGEHGGGRDGADTARCPAASTPVVFR
jgi:hypothetical protein